MTGAIAEAVTRYTKEIPRLKNLSDASRKRLLRVADGAGIKCRVIGRVKDVRSFHKKILTKGYTDPWREVTDKIGIRVIVEMPDDVDRLVDVIKQKLQDLIVRIEDKRESLEPSQLGYSGVHVQLRAERVAEGREAVECEVQIRTITQDAWSVVSHKMLYKPTVELPPRLQRAVYRLVALVEMFDEEVQRVMAEIPTLPGYEVVDLIDLAETHFLSVGHSPSNRALSFQVLRHVAQAIDVEERESYPNLLGTFVESERAKLSQLYGEYGAHSAVGYVPEYMLFGQAESLILLERMSCRPHRLASSWRDSGLPWIYLQTLADAAGIPLPTD